MKEKLIDKIKKLLRLATSSNPNEAALAMEKATLLMAEHKISMLDVNNQKDAEPEKVTHTKYQPRKGQKRRTQWHAIVMSGVCKVTNTDRFWQPVVTPDGKHVSGHYVLIGKPSDIAVAQEMAEWLIAEINRLVMRSPFEGKADRMAFCAGAAQTVKRRLIALHGKIEEAKPQYGALMVVDWQAVQQYKAKFGTLEKMQGSKLSGSQSARRAGRLAGENVALGGIKIQQQRQERLA